LSEPLVVHAGLIAARDNGPWRGVLIEGPAGAGKSDLALRALCAGFRLVADDRVALWVLGGALYGRAPATLAGLIEARGLGIAGVTALPLAQVVLVARAGTPERMPEPAFADILGLRLPLLILDLRESSAPAKLSHALSHFDGAPNRRI
jgi:serine kinase of HPr protein (carbohydrate metabolism regulator)